MHCRSLLFLLGTCCIPGALLAQYSIGVQGGPLFFQGAWEAKKELSNTSGWMVGIQVVEGRTGKNGFRVGLDYGERSYTMRARNINRMEEYDMVTSMIWLSTEMRWPLSRRFGLFFDLGPVIGFEVKERREGINYYEDGRPGDADSTMVNEVEHGFAISDGHWRIGLSAQVPIGGNWKFMAGAHLCPGVGSWAQGHGYATMDASMRAGLLCALKSKRKYGRVI